MSMRLVRERLLRGISSYSGILARMDPRHACAVLEELPWLFGQGSTTGVSHNCPAKKGLLNTCQLAA